MMLLEIIIGLGRALPQSFRSRVSKLPLGSWIKFGPVPVLVNKILLELSYTYLFRYCLWLLLGFSGAQVVKNPPANAGDMGLLLGLERSPR